MNKDRVNKNQKAVFKSLILLGNGGNIANKIEALFKALLLIMYCISPEQKHYSVIDNIEECIKLDKSKVQIYDSDISTIYQSIKAAVTNVTTLFNRIQEDLAWKVFKVIFVIRRTSLWLLDSTMLQCPMKSLQNTYDITGQFQVPAIWRQKKQHVWNNRLSKRHTDSKSTQLVTILDFMMADSEEAARGITFQMLIAPLMSYGIRRNARAQAHCACETHKILTTDGNAMDFDCFEKIMENIDDQNSAVRYMFRRGLIELQFRWAIASGSPTRWKNLGIGHLANHKTTKYQGKLFNIQEVSYISFQNVSLVRRILTVLSYHVDNLSTPIEKRRGSALEAFSTISLYDLICGVLLNPSGKNIITDDDFIAFARVLIALGDMSNDETKSAPYVILNVNDAHTHASVVPETLAQKCKEIWKAGLDSSLPGKQYDCSDFGARITEAGYSFLLDWQASFSFMASLYCFTFPPLFFLRDKERICYVIETVYKEAKRLCKMYEDDAARFCENNNKLTLKCAGYLVKHGGRYITFRERVKVLHLNHLRLYCTFVQTCSASLGMSSETVKAIEEKISEYINLYQGWNTDEGAKQCF